MVLVHVWCMSFPTFSPLISRLSSAVLSNKGKSQNNTVLKSHCHNEALHELIQDMKVLRPAAVS